MYELDPIYNPLNGPKSHHYIPQFYLRQFIDKKGCFAVFDRETNRYHSNQNPKNWFCINHLYSFRPKGVSLFSLEKAVLDPHDGEAAGAFLKIWSQNSTPTLRDKMTIIHFLLNLFWRIPASDQIFRDLLNKNGLRSRVFGFYDTGRDCYYPEEELEEIRQQMVSDIHTLKISKHLVGNSDESAWEAAELSQQWILGKQQLDSEPYIIGDNPFIRLNPELRYDQVFGELIIPISKNQVLSFLKSKNKVDSTKFVNRVNLAIVHQSRFIASPNMAYLQNLIDEYTCLSIKQQNNLTAIVFN
jgi:hypothetical protein